MNAKVFTTVPGLVVRIGPWYNAIGEPQWAEASNETPALIPDDVADQFEAEIRGHRFDEVDDPDKPGQKKRVRVDYPKKATHLRIEREHQAPKRAAPTAVEEKK